MKLYNTLTRQIDNFTPLKPSQVTVYSCGPTVYDRQHIGNFSAYIYWDILVRTLELNDYQVKRVINLTDVGHLTSDADDGEDKLAKKADLERQTAWQIADQYIDLFLADFKKLNLKQPDYWPRATKFVPQQLEVIKKLKQLGYTYQINDGIYYDTAKFTDYGKMAGLDLDKLKAGARVKFNQQKRNITDFALWKFSQSQKRDMEWLTPDEILDQTSSQQIMGFPGWHLECSTMAYNLLGDQIDIHTGGIDHIQIHHTNEIAQIEPITGKQFSQFWLHNNHLKIDGTKVSKSLGNTYNLDQLAEHGFSPSDFKMFVLQSHYQTEGNFTFELLEKAQARLANWRKIACLRHQIHDGITADEDKKLNFLAATHKILELANNNLQTPQILALIDQEMSKMTSVETNYANVNRQSFTDFLQQIDDLLGLDLIESTPDISENNKRLIQQRVFAKQAKDYQTADQIRDQLKEQGIELNDSIDRSYWYYS